MNNIPLTYYTISLLIGGFTALISGILVIAQDWRRSENQAWFVLTMCTSIWSFAYFFMTISQTYESAMFSNWILHYAAFFIPLFYYLLVLTITDTFRKNRIIFVFFTICALFFTFINHDPSFVADVIPKVGFNYAPVPGPYYIYFFFYFVIVILVGLITTARVAYRTKDQKEKVRLLYTIFFTIAASVGGGSVFATTFFNSIPPYLLILFSIYPAISGYAILRYQLFDTKVIATQMFLSAVWIFIFIRILLSESPREQLANTILLAVTLFLGFFLMQSVKKEVFQREKIEGLAKDLQQSNTQLEKANDRLKELDQLKTEFVSLATHQIRAPLTAIKGYISLIQEGDYGPIPDKIKSVLDIIIQSTNNLVTIVGDFLDVSRIEQGKMKYDFTDFDVEKLVNEVVTEFRPNVEKRGLEIQYHAEPSNYIVHADQGKIKQVIGNVLDNSIKYTPQGHIDVSINNLENKILIKISDTGVGIPAQTLPKLFQKFTRAENANETNILGTGLGLYVAKQMIEAQNGRIWAESEGEGKGSKFYIELTPTTK